MSHRQFICFVLYEKLIIGVACHLPAWLITASSLAHNKPPVLSSNQPVTHINSNSRHHVKWSRTCLLFHAVHMLVVSVECSQKISMAELITAASTVTSRHHLVLASCAQHFGGMLRQTGKSLLSSCSDRKLKKPFK